MYSFLMILCLIINIQTHTYATASNKATSIQNEEHLLNNLTTILISRNPTLGKMQSAEEALSSERPFTNGHGYQYLNDETVTETPRHKVFEGAKLKYRGKYIAKENPLSSRVKRDTYMNIPPAPTLPPLNLNEFPDLMKTLLSSRNSARVPNPSPTPYEYVSQHLRNNPAESIINNTMSFFPPLPQNLKNEYAPKTYGLNLRGNEGFAWNNLADTRRPQIVYYNTIKQNKENAPQVNLINPKELTKIAQHKLENKVTAAVKDKNKEHDILKWTEKEENQPLLTKIDAIISENIEPEEFSKDLREISAERTSENHFKNSLQAEEKESNDMMLKSRIDNQINDTDPSEVLEILHKIYIDGKDMNKDIDGLNKDPKTDIKSKPIYNDEIPTTDLKTDTKKYISSFKLPVNDMSKSTGANKHDFQYQTDGQTNKNNEDVETLAEKMEKSFINIMSKIPAYKQNNNDWNMWGKEMGNLKDTYGMHIKGGSGFVWNKLTPNNHEHYVGEQNDAKTKGYKDDIKSFKQKIDYDKDSETSAKNPLEDFKDINIGKSHINSSVHMNNDTINTMPIVDTTTISNPVLIYSAEQDDSPVSHSEEENSTTSSNDGHESCISEMSYRTSDSSVEHSNKVTEAPVIEELPDSKNTLNLEFLLEAHKNESSQEQQDSTTQTTFGTSNSGIEDHSIEDTGVIEDLVEDSPNANNTLNLEFLLHPHKKGIGQEQHDSTTKVNFGISDNNYIEERSNEDKGAKEDLVEDSSDANNTLNLEFLLQPHKKGISKEEQDSTTELNFRTSDNNYIEEHSTEDKDATEDLIEDTSEANNTLNLEFLLQPLLTKHSISMKNLSMNTQAENKDSQNNKIQPEEFNEIISNNIENGGKLDVKLHEQNKSEPLHIEKQNTDSNDMSPIIVFKEESNNDDDDKKLINIRSYDALDIVKKQHNKDTIASLKLPKLDSNKEIESNVLNAQVNKRPLVFETESSIVMDDDNTDAQEKNQGSIEKSDNIINKIPAFIQSRTVASETGSMEHTFGMHLQGGKGYVWSKLGPNNYNYFVGEHKTNGEIMDQNGNINGSGSKRDNDCANLDYLLQTAEFWEWFSKWSSSKMDIINEKIRHLVSKEIGRQFAERNINVIEERKSEKDKTKPEHNKTMNVKAQIIYGNSMASDHVTNIFVFNDTNSSNKADNITSNESNETVTDAPIETLNNTPSITDPEHENYVISRINRNNNDKESEFVPKYELYTDLDDSNYTIPLNENKNVIRKLINVRSCDLPPIDSQIIKNLVKEEVVKQLAAIKYNINNKGFTNKENFDKVATQPNANKISPTMRVDAHTVYGNSQGSDHVTNIFIFYPNTKTLKDIKNAIDFEKNDAVYKSSSKGTRLPNKADNVPNEGTSKLLESTLKNKGESTSKHVDMNTTLSFNDAELTIQGKQYMKDTKDFDKKQNTAPAENLSGIDNYNITPTVKPSIVNEEKIDRMKILNNIATDSTQLLPMEERMGNNDIPIISQPGKTEVVHTVKAASDENVIEIVDYNTTAISSNEIGERTEKQKKDETLINENLMLMDVRTGIGREDDDNNRNIDIYNVTPTLKPSIVNEDKIDWMKILKNIATDSTQLLPIEERMENNDIPIINQPGKTEVVHTVKAASDENVIEIVDYNTTTIANNEVGERTEMQKEDETVINENPILIEGRKGIGREEDDNNNSIDNYKFTPTIKPSIVNEENIDWMKILNNIAIDSTQLLPIEERMGNNDIPIINQPGKTEVVHTVKAASDENVIVDYNITTIANNEVGERTEMQKNDEIVINENPILMDGRKGTGKEEDDNNNSIDNYKCSPTIKPSIVNEEKVDWMKILNNIATDSTQLLPIEERMGNNDIPIINQPGKTEVVHTVKAASDENVIEIIDYNTTTIANNEVGERTEMQKKDKTVINENPILMEGRTGIGREDDNNKNIIIDIENNNKSSTVHITTPLPNITKINNESSSSKTVTSTDVEIMGTSSLIDSTAISIDTLVTSSPEEIGIDNGNYSTSISITSSSEITEFEGNNDTMTNAILTSEPEENMIEIESKTFRETPTIVTASSTEIEHNEEVSAMITPAPNENATEKKYDSTTIASNKEVVERPKVQNKEEKVINDDSILTKNRIVIDSEDDGKRFFKNENKKITASDQITTPKPNKNATEINYDRTTIASSDEVSERSKIQKINETLINENSILMENRIIIDSDGDDDNRIFTNENKNKTASDQITTPSLNTKGVNNNTASLGTLTTSEAKITTQTERSNTNSKGTVVMSAPEENVTEIGNDNTTVNITSFSKSIITTEIKDNNEAVINLIVTSKPKQNIIQIESTTLPTTKTEHNEETTVNAVTTPAPNENATEMNNDSTTIASSDEVAERPKAQEKNVTVMNNNLVKMENRIIIDSVGDDDNRMFATVNKNKTATYQTTAPSVNVKEINNNTASLGTLTTSDAEITAPTERSTTTLMGTEGTSAPEGNVTEIGNDNTTVKITSPSTSIVTNEMNDKNETVINAIVTSEREENIIKIESTTFSVIPTIVTAPTTDVEDNKETTVDAAITPSPNENATKINYDSTITTSSNELVERPKIQKKNETVAKTVLIKHETLNTTDATQADIEMTEFKNNLKSILFAVVKSPKEENLTEIADSTTTSPITETAITIEIPDKKEITRNENGMYEHSVTTASIINKSPKKGEVQKVRETALNDIIRSILVERKIKIDKDENNDTISYAVEKNGKEALKQSDTSVTTLRATTSSEANTLTESEDNKPTITKITSITEENLTEIDNDSAKGSSKTNSESSTEENEITLLENVTTALPEEHVLEISNEVFK